MKIIKLKTIIKSRIALFLFFFLTTTISLGENINLFHNRAQPEINKAIPLGGNAFVTQKGKSSTPKITTQGLKNWSDSMSIISIFFRVERSGELHLGIRSETVPGEATIKLSVGKEVFVVDLSKGVNKTDFAGSVSVANPGYVRVDLQGIKRTGTFFANISDLLIGGAASEGSVIFANDPENFYWSRRGPSCHLNYSTPDEDKEYFYSELTVPKGEDKLGSYFMANGFGEGYMGIQVNSATERRILFSVWDPDNGKTTLIKKGTGVHAGGFGGEGTGGQSYLVFNWKAGVTYKFLTRGQPDNKGNTIYTSWFFDPDRDSWKLIASWKRPNTHTWLTRFHGFLENFIPNEGYQERKALWGNQWVRLANGNWVEVTECKFTIDATGRNKQRMDYAGGIENNRFFLRMGGFFNETVLPDTKFSKARSQKPPGINLNNLP